MQHDSVALKLIDIQHTDEAHASTMNGFTRGTNVRIEGPYRHIHSPVDNGNVVIRLSVFSSPACRVFENFPPCFHLGSGVGTDSMQAINILIWLQKSRRPLGLTSLTQY